MKNVCIAGYGAVAPVHAGAVEKLNSAKLYAVCDINPDKNEICKSKYDVIAYTDFDEMLKDKNIDSVHICTPHYLHFEMIEKAVKCGKNVLCEKPVVMTKSEFDKLLCFQEKDKINVVLQNRLNPCFVRLKEITESGQLGKVVGVKGVVAWQRTAEYYLKDSWRGKWESEGGGVLINQAIHTLDYLCLIAGKARSVKANMCNLSLPEIEVEDTITACIDFQNGIKGLFFATNSNSANSSVDFEVFFENGEARYTDNKLYINGELVEEDLKPVHGKKYWGLGHKKLIKNYYDEGMGFPVESVQDTMYTTFAIYESAKNNGVEIII